MLKKYFEEKSCPNNNFVILIKRIKMDTAPVKHFFSGVILYNVGLISATLLCLVFAPPREKTGVEGKGDAWTHIPKQQLVSKPTSNATK